MKRKGRLCITLVAIGCLVATTSPAAWAAPDHGPIEARADAAWVPALSGLWAEVQTVWRQALGALLGASASGQSAPGEPSGPASSLDGGPTCQEVGTWAGCINDPDG